MKEIQRIRCTSCGYVIQGYDDKCPGCGIKIDFYIDEVNKINKMSKNNNYNMKEQDLTKMEFLLTLNDRIIVQRFYNVRNFNPEAKNSLELYEFVKEIKDDLEHDLKGRTVVYMLDNISEIMEDENVLNTSMTDGEELFNIYLKVDDVTICHRIFNAKLFPPKVRYTVDIRPYLKDILRGLTDIFSEENLTYEYLELPLTV